MEAVPEAYQHTIAFLCVDDPDSTKRIPKATGFFVSVPIENSPDSRMIYIVTARHCIEKARQYKQIYIRFNLKEGRGKFLEPPTIIDDWYIHDTADVATIPLLPNALPKGVKASDLDIAVISIDSFCGGAPDYKVVFETSLYGRKEIQPRVGHQIYFIGLFTEHYGVERNLPIARFGHISRMPDLINITVNDANLNIIAYLVEFHSIGGHSGSPVFFLYPMVIGNELPITLKKGIKASVDIVENLLWVSGFIGLISGHYPIPESAEKSGEFKTIEGDIRTNLNSGIALVTPAEAVKQLLMRNDLVEQRKKLGDIIEAKHPKPIMDVSINHDTSSEKKIY